MNFTEDYGNIVPPILLTVAIGFMFIGIVVSYVAKTRKMVCFLTVIIGLYVASFVGRIFYYDIAFSSIDIIYVTLLAVVLSQQTRFKYLLVPIVFIPHLFSFVYNMILVDAEKVYSESQQYYHHSFHYIIQNCSVIVISMVVIYLSESMRRYRRRIKVFHESLKELNFEKKRVKNILKSKHRNDLVDLIKRMMEVIDEFVEFVPRTVLRGLVRRMRGEKGVKKDEEDSDYDNSYDIKKKLKLRRTESMELSELEYGSLGSPPIEKIVEFKRNSRTRSGSRAGKFRLTKNKGDEETILGVAEKQCSVVCVHFRNLFEEERDRFEGKRGSFSNRLKTCTMVVERIDEAAKDYRGEVISVTEKKAMIAFNLFSPHAHHQTVAVEFACKLKTELEYLNSLDLSNSLNFIQFSFGICSGGIYYGYIGTKERQVERVFGNTRKLASLLSDYGMEHKIGIAIARSTANFLGKDYEKEVVDYLHFPKLSLPKKALRIYQLSGKRRRLNQVDWQALMVRNTAKGKEDEMEVCWKLFERDQLKRCKATMEKNEMNENNKLFDTICKLLEEGKSFSDMVEERSKFENFSTSMVSIYSSYLE